MIYEGAQSKRLRQPASAEPNFDNFCVQKFVRIYVRFNECAKIFSCERIYVAPSACWNTIFADDE